MSKRVGNDDVRADRGRHRAVFMFGVQCTSQKRLGYCLESQLVG